MTFTSRLLIGISLLTSGYAAVLGVGFVLRLAPLTYYVDDWVWLSFNVMDGAGSFCRITGHPTITTNLAMAANYFFFDGSPAARAMTAAAVHVAGMGLLGIFAGAGSRLCRPLKITIVTVFACIGLSGTLSSKLFWSFGLTDGFVLVGGGLAVLGLQLLPRLRAVAWLLIFTGTVLGAFSFGSGLVLPAAMLFALICLRENPRAIAAYLVAAAVMLWVVMVWLPPCEHPPASVGDVVFAPWTILKTAAVVLAYFPAYVAGGQNALGTTELSPFWIGLGLLLITMVTVHAIRLIIRGERNAFRVGLAALVLNFIGAALLIGLTRAPTYGIEVGFQARYAPITTAFWALCAAIIVCELAMREARFVASAVVIVSAVLAFANTMQAPHYLAFHRYLASSAASVVLAAKSENVNENLRRYMGLSEWVMKPLSMLVTARKDLFAQAENRMVVEAQPIPDMNFPSCRGSGFRMMQLDEPGIFGLGGWATAPEGSRLRQIIVFLDEHASGVGYPASLPIDHSISEEAGLLRSVPAAFLVVMPTLARSIGYQAGWVALVMGSSTTADIRVIGRSSEGFCEVSLRKN